MLLSSARGSPLATFSGLHRDENGPVAPGPSSQVVLRRPRNLSRAGTGIAGTDESISLAEWYLLMALGSVIARFGCHISDFRRMVPVDGTRSTILASAALK